MYSISPTIRLSITLTLACISHLISSARLVYRWRHKARQPRTVDLSQSVIYKDQHPKRYLWQMSLFILVTFTTTTALAVPTIIEDEPYTTILAAWIIVACWFHEAVISTCTWRIGMNFFKPWHIWSGFAAAWVLLLVGVVIQLLEISNYGLIIAKVSANGYHLYFIWEWINVVAARGQSTSGREAGLREKTYLMARIVLTLAAFVFLLPSSNDSDLMASHKPQQHGGIIANIRKATAATFAAYDVFQSASLVPEELHQSPEVGVELEPRENKPTSQWRLDEDKDTRDYAFRMPSQETLNSV